MTQRKTAPRKRAGKPAARRGSTKRSGTKRSRSGGRKKRGAAPTKLRARRVATLFAFMLLLSGLLLWGVIEISRHGTAETTPNVVGGRQDETHDTDITDADRRQLKELLETIENERTKN